MVIIDIDMPKHCGECPIKYWDAFNEVDRCPAKNAMCLKAMRSNTGRLANCPLYEIDIDIETFTVLVQMAHQYTTSDVTEALRIAEEMNKGKEVEADA